MADTETEEEAEEAVTTRHAAGIFVPEYAAGTRSADFAWWCRNFLIQSVDRFADLPLVLEEWQLRFFSEALSFDEDDRPYWNLVTLVLPRKNGKTLMLAAYSLYHLLEDDGSPEILLAASSDKQAGRLFEAAVAFVRRHEELDSRLHLRDYIGEIARADGQGKVLRMASDPSRAHGYNPSLVVADEVHAWGTPSLRKAWGAFVSGSGARERRQTFAITTAGEASERQDGILGTLIDTNERCDDVEHGEALTISRNHAGRTLVYNYSAPTKDPRDAKGLKKANPASWITEEFLEMQALSGALSEPQVLQLHGCVWAEGTGTWITAPKWQACQADAKIPDDAHVYVGVDAAWSRDTTAVAWAYREPLEDGRVVVRARVWSVRADVAHDVLHEGNLDNDEVCDWIIGDLANEYRLAEVVYDPRYFSSQGLRLQRAGVRTAPMEQWQIPMREAWDTFYELVEDRLVAHDGSRVLAEHVGAAAGKRTDRGWKVRAADTGRSPRPIDALAAAVMAVSRAARSTTASVYERKELLLL